MMRKFFCAFLALPLLFVSCSDAVQSDGKAARKSERAAVDMASYKDVTSPDVNAALVGKAGFAFLASGTYRNGGSSVTLDFSSGKARFYCPSVPAGPYKGKVFDCEFVYDVRAAGRDLLYLCPLTRSSVSVGVGDERILAVWALPFCLFLPLYGFGEGRLEVSSVMDGEIVMPSGTYWKVR